MASRLKSMGVNSYRNGFRLTLHSNLLDAPLRWKKSRNVFVNSMSDLFHDRVPLEFIQNVFATMRAAKQHNFQLLTKRSANLKKFSSEIEWPDNVWMGVSVETTEYRQRIHDLQDTKAQVKFLSIEPLLGPIAKLPLSGIDWVIVGGESGPGARSMEGDWVRGIRDQCIKKNVPFFFKQWGGNPKKKYGRLLDGRTWDEMPRKFSKSER